MPNTFELIASSTVGAGGALTIDFSSIPSTFTDLCVLVSARNALDVQGDMGLRLNANSGANYSRRTLLGTGTGAASGSSSGDTLLTRAGVATGTDCTASTFCNSTIYIPNYAGSTNKSISIDSVTENNATLAYAQMVAGLWSQTAAINQITLYVNSANLLNTFAQYSTAYLYGVKNA